MLYLVKPTAVLLICCWVACISNHTQINGAIVGFTKHNNGDGLDDLIVGAKGGDLNNITNVGKSYVVFGKANSSAINLSAIADASNPLGGFVINGEAKYALLSALPNTT
jgi:hypothetical protein